MEPSNTDEPKMEFVTVGYIPSNGRRFSTGTKLLFDEVWSRNFEAMLGQVTPIDPKILGKHLHARDKNATTCRAQIMAQGGVTDVHTAEALSTFYKAVEDEDWDRVTMSLHPDLDYWVPNEMFNSPRGLRRQTFVEQLKQYVARYEGIYFDIEWANISTGRAMVKFDVRSNGSIVNKALSEYHFDLIDDRILLTGVWNHSDKSIPLFISANDN